MMSRSFPPSLFDAASVPGANVAEKVQKPVPRPKKGKKKGA